MLSAILEQTSSKDFRFDVNALRAYAFIAVLLYHFRIPGFDGGFVGVDIFLTISGYLIMSIVSRAVEVKNFNLIEFYTRRIGRIIAPILPVVVATFVVGYSMLPPSAFSDFGRYAIGMLTFTSNVMFWRESGYFNADNAYNLLLHSWSLSLEVQFYVIFPIIFFVLRLLFKTRRSIIAALLFLTVVIFVVSVFATQLKPIPAFYLLPTRLWQFLLGGLVWQVMSMPLGLHQRQSLHIFGVILVGMSVALIDSSMSWPGWRAGIPSLGVAFILLSNINIRRVYESTVVRTLGVISYSGYLWHWPIVVVLLILNKIESPLWQIAGILLTLVLGLLSWFIAERLLGSCLGGLSSVRRLSAIAALTVSAALLPGAAVYSNGMPSRFTAELNRFLNTAEERPGRRVCDDNIQDHCVVAKIDLDRIGSITGIGAIVVGDSHAAMISQIVANSLTAANSKVISLAVPACPTIRDVRVALDQAEVCAKTVDTLLTLHRLYPKIPIIVSNRYAFYMNGPNERTRSARPNYSPSRETYSWSQAYKQAMSQGYHGTLCPVAERGVLLLVDPFPEFLQAIPPRIAQEVALLGTYTDFTLTQAEYTARNADVMPVLDRLARECGAHRVNPVSTLCPDGVCTGTYDGSILFTDSNHISSAGAALTAQAFSNTVKILNAESIGR